MIRPMSVNDGIPAKGKASVIRDENMYALLHGKDDSMSKHGDNHEADTTASSFHGIATAFRDGFDKAYYGRPRSEQVADAAGQALGKAAKHADKVVPVVVAAVAAIAVRKAVKRAIFG